MADNPMVASMAGILGNAGLIATMGQLERINRESFMVSDGEISGLIGGRILIQGSGSDMDAPTWRCPRKRETECWNSSGPAMSVNCET